MSNNNRLQLIIAALIVLGGLALLYVGALVEPKGQVHESLLVAFGEAATFAGSILGIDYKYRHHGNNNSGTDDPRG